MRWLASLPFHLRIALITGLAVLCWTVVQTLAALVSPGVSPDFANKDFANYWTAGKLVLSGQAADLFGPQPGYFAHLTAAFGPDYPWHNWSYPPHFLFLVWPLGLTGYKAGMALFLGLTGAFYLWAAFRLAGGRDRAMLILIAIVPFLAHNLWAAQNGYLFAGCALAALALRDSRPILAGVFLGVLTIKPQLGVLFPFLLLAERRWTVIASATATTAALALGSAAMFGWDAWHGYFGEVVPYQTHVMRDFEGVFLSMMPSLYGALRSLGVEAGLALPLHLLVALPAMAVTIAAFFLARRDEDRTILLAVATFVVVPYALSYDLGLIAPALALLAARLPAAGAGRALLAAAILLPVLMIPLGALHAPLAPVVIFSVWLVALRESGVRERARALFRRSPAAASG